MKWAIIGSAGFIAPRHKKAIEELGDEVIAYCDTEYKEDSFTEGVAFFKSFSSFMNSPFFKDVDGIVICTPNYFHKEMVLDCIYAHKLVLCEKPLALTTKEVEEIIDAQYSSGWFGVFSVFQLRYHPLLHELKQIKQNEIESVKMTIRVKRGTEYWNSWKGKEELSGGILVNIGVHYLDILLQLFGEKYEVAGGYYAPNKAGGKIMFQGIPVEFEVEIIEDDVGQERSIEINGKKYNFSSRDNLSYEDLHTKVYEGIKNKQGVQPIECQKVIKLIEEIKCKTF